MFYISVALLLFVITSLINFILVRFNFFIDNKKLLPHKSFVNNKISVPYSGGIILLICLFFLIPSIDIIHKIFFLCIFFLGLFSDSEKSNSPILLQHFNDAEQECLDLLIDKKHSLALPAYDQCIKASHIFNLLDARGMISVSERQAYILRVRNMTRSCCLAWIDKHVE